MAPVAAIADHAAVIRDARDLATIDCALERARELTARRLVQQRKPASWYRRLAAGKVKPRRPFTPRDQRLPLESWARDERLERRARQVEAGVAVAVTDAGAADYYTALYDEAERRGGREVRYAAIREAVAAKLEQVAAIADGLPGTLGRRDFLEFAGKLRGARKSGYWGINLDTGELVMRFTDRSGLALLDPSEARERQAELVRRLVPELARLQRAGLRLYYAVASEPNVPAGSLAFGKAHIFERFRRVILGRTADGRAAADGGAFPEIVGAFAVQEDPLSSDLATWNVHLNLILAVDPKQAEPLPPELLDQLELRLPGKVEKLAPRRTVDATPAGCLSYAKVHFAWGSDQFFIRPLEGRTAEELGKRLLEVVKYSAKWVSSKRLEELVAGGSPQADQEPPGAVPPPLELEGGPWRPRRSRHALGVTEWPLERVAEWVGANRRFRRCRGWGALYRIAAEELEPDPDAAGRIRWLGRVFIQPRGVIVWAARLSYVSSTHGDKSGRDFRAEGPDPRARAGPPGLVAAA